MVRKGTVAAGSFLFVFFLRASIRVCVIACDGTLQGRLCICTCNSLVWTNVCAFWLGFRSLTSIFKWRLCGRSPVFAMYIPTKFGIVAAVYPVFIIYASLFLSASNNFIQSIGYSYNLLNANAFVVPVHSLLCACARLHDCQKLTIGQRDRPRSCEIVAYTSDENIIYKYELHGIMLEIYIFRWRESDIAMIFVVLTAKAVHPLFFFHSIVWKLYFQSEAEAIFDVAALLVQHSEFLLAYFSCQVPLPRWPASHTSDICYLFITCIEIPYMTSVFLSFTQQLPSL